MNCSNNFLSVLDKNRKDFFIKRFLIHIFILIFFPKKTKVFVVSSFSIYLKNYILSKLKNPCYAINLCFVFCRQCWYGRFTRSKGDSRRHWIEGRYRKKWYLHQRRPWYGRTTRSTRCHWLHWKLW